MNQSVLITGASSGIGEALAREYARRGARVAILARRIERLDVMREELLALGAPAVAVHALDVRIPETIEPALRACALQLDGIDTVIANAGVAHGALIGEASLEVLRETLEVNLLGACATVDAAVRYFREQGHGQVVGITSVARYRGLPSFGAYSASKSGLQRYLQALRAETWHERITVTEIAPGYIDTPMNNTMASRPFVIDAGKGARIIADQIARGVASTTAPWWPWRILGRVMQLLPTRLLAPRARR